MRGITTVPAATKDDKRTLQLYPRKFNRLGEMDKFLKNHKLS